MSIPMQTLIVPAVTYIAATYGAMGGPAPCAMMAAIGLQESRFSARDQLEAQNGILVPGRLGPATGFWQFELNGGVKGVMSHPSSRRAALELSEAAGVPFVKEEIWEHFSTIEGDELAAAFARLLLLTDAQPLPMPELQNEEIAWQYYLRNWRPGKPHREFWAANWRDGVASSGSAPAVMPPVPRPAMPDELSVLRAGNEELRRRLADIHAISGV